MKKGIPETYSLLHWVWVSTRARGSCVVVSSRVFFSARLGCGRSVIYVNDEGSSGCELRRGSLGGSCRPLGELELLALVEKKHRREAMLARIKPGQKWQHKKRGSLYTILSVGKFQCSEEAFANLDYRETVVYQGEKGDVWVRLVSEFLDGRFIYRKGV